MNSRICREWNKGKVFVGEDLVKPVFVGLRVAVESDSYFSTSILFVTVPGKNAFKNTGIKKSFVYELV